MWRSPVLVTAATALPITIEQARAELRFDTSDHDVRLQRYMEAAVAHIEAVTGARLASQTVDLITTDWGDLGRFPVAPVTSVTSVKYFDTAGAEQTLSGSVFAARLDGLMPGLDLVSGQAWPPTFPGSAITVRAVVGYATAPSPVVSALLILVRALNDDGGIDGVAGTVEALIANTRTFSVL
jgi:uncharacterized phiE125 gp8 family phage protein